MGNGSPIDLVLRTRHKGLATYLPITRTDWAGFWEVYTIINVIYYGGVFGRFCHICRFAAGNAGPSDPNAGRELHGPEY